MSLATNHRWRYSLLIHAVALFLLLSALMPFVTSAGVWTSDEGALMYQAERFASTGEWGVGHPFPEADPAGAQFPLELSRVTDEGTYVSYPRHKHFVWIYGHVYLLAGYRGLIVLSVLGGTIAAFVAGAIGRRMWSADPAVADRVGVVALWALGVASPMLFNSFIAWAHTIAAAIFAVAFYLFTSERSPAASIVAGAVCLFVGTQVRTEMLLGGVALALGLMVEHVWRNRAFCRAMVPVRGLTALFAVVNGFVFKAFWGAPAGEATRPESFEDIYGHVVLGRFQGFSKTWLHPGTESVSSLLLIVGAACLVSSGFLAGRRERWRAAALVSSAGMLAVLFAAAVLGWSFADGVSQLPSTLVGGLVIAFPTLFASLFLCKRHQVESRTGFVAVVTVAFFFGAVLGTQYKGGGGSEWGGRYFALGLPLLVPIAVSGLIGWRFRSDGKRQMVCFKFFLAALLVSQLFLSFLGLSRIRDQRLAVERLDVLVAAAELQVGDRPVVVSAESAAGRWLWHRVGSGRWLWAADDELHLTAVRLRDLNVERLVIVSFDPEADLRSVSSSYAPVAGQVADAPVVVMEMVGLEGVD